jgi:hypothetical protein
VFRRLIVVAGVALLACALAAPALGVRVKVRVEGKTTTIFGSTQPALTTGPNALAALDTASIAGEFYYHVRQTSFGPFVDQIGLYPGAGTSGWSYKINGVSPPVGADQATLKDGDTVLWYWSTFTEQGGSPTLLLRKRKARNCYTVVSQNDPGVSTQQQAHDCSSTGGAKTRAGRGCVGSIAASSARRCRTRCASNALAKLCRPRRPCARPAARMRARAHRVGERDAVGHSRSGRDRGRPAHGAGRADSDAGTRPGARREDEVQRTFRAVDPGGRRRRVEAA